MKTKSLKDGIKAGEPHAEVNAVNSVKDKSLLKKLQFYESRTVQSFGKHPLL
jgi:diaminohydroxyphosphoribosylaminopyrimidine deaminase/5-amino-6-(5-phosphoribosylamino)uracil reductase